MNNGYITLLNGELASVNDLKNFIIDAIEIGITDWALLHNDTEDFEQYYENTNLTTSEIVAELVLNNKNVIITDIENDVEPLYDLNLTRLLKGIYQNQEERPYDCDLENYDATTCDCIIQYAIFADNVFC